MNHLETSVSRPTTVRAQLVLALFWAGSGLAGCTSDTRQELSSGGSASLDTVQDDGWLAALSEGRLTFRFETFGDEKFWTDVARMHEVVSQSVSPSVALKVGLKVDSEALPAELAAALREGKVDLESPASTIALLKANAVVGLVGRVETVDGKDALVRLGITCALCHSTVDDSLAPGIGRRLDGWANRDLDVGAIISLSPAITAEQKQVYGSWGAGKYDPRYNQDGLSTPLVMPPIYGLAAVKNETFTAEGPISYWNAYVAVTQMHGQGVFSDPRLNIDVQDSPDLVTPKLPALRVYQHSLQTPKDPAPSGTPAALARGRELFAQSCAKCHVDGNGTDNNAGTLHAAAETGMDPKYAARTASKKYRTTPLRGLWQHPPYFHDGSAATLADVVEHYDSVLTLRLGDVQKRELVEYLGSL